MFHVKHFLYAKLFQADGKVLFLIKQASTIDEHQKKI